MVLPERITQLNPAVRDDLTIPGPTNSGQIGEVIYGNGLDTMRLSDILKHE